MLPIAKNGWCWVCLNSHDDHSSYQTDGHHSCIITPAAVAMVTSTISTLFTALSVVLRLEMVSNIRKYVLESILTLKLFETQLGPEKSLN